MFIFLRTPTGCPIRDGQRWPDLRATPKERRNNQMGQQRIPQEDWQLLIKLLPVAERLRGNLILVHFGNFRSESFGGLLLLHVRNNEIISRGYAGQLRTSKGMSIGRSSLRQLSQQFQRVAFGSSKTLRARHLRRTRFAVSTASGSSSSSRSGGMHTCRRCKQQFRRDDNSPNSCRYHPALFTGGEISKVSQ